MTSETMSRIRVSLIVLMTLCAQIQGFRMADRKYGVRRQAQRNASFGHRRKSGVALRLPPHSIFFRRSSFGFSLLFGVINLFAQDIHSIHNSDDDGVHRRVLEVGREPGGTTLAKH